MQAINGCKEGFNLSTSMTQRDQNQGSLKGYLQPSSTPVNASVPVALPGSKSGVVTPLGGSMREGGEQRQASLKALWNK